MLVLIYAKQTCENINPKKYPTSYQQCCGTGTATFNLSGTGSGSGFGSKSNTKRKSKKTLKKREKLSGKQCCF
jgi:hypothetical protein